MGVEVRKVPIIWLRQAMGYSEKTEIVSIRLSYEQENAPPVVKVVMWHD